MRNIELEIHGYARTLKLNSEQELAALLVNDCKPSDLPKVLARLINEEVSSEIADIIPLIVDRAMDGYTTEIVGISDAAVKRARDVLAINGARNVTAPKSYVSRTKAARYHGSRIAKPSQAGKEYLYERWISGLNNGIAGMLHWSVVKQHFKTMGARTHKEAVEAFGYLLETKQAEIVNITHKSDEHPLTGEFIRFR